MDIPSRLDLFQIGRKYVLDNATKIDPKQVDTAGSNINLFVGVSSVIGEHLLNQLLYRTGALLIDGSEDEEDLYRLVFDRYQLSPKAAAAGVASIRIRRSSFAAGAGSVAVGSVVSSPTADYVTTTTATFGSTSLESTCDVRSVAAGAASRVAAGAIKSFRDPGSLFDTSLIPTNEEPSAGNEDAETPDQFRARSKQFWKASRKGILPAIEFGAMEVPGVVSAQAIEAVDPSGDAARFVNLYFGDSTGTANQTLAKLVKISLQEWRAGGIIVLTDPSLPQLISIILRLRFLAGVDTDSLTENIRSAITAFVNSLPANGPLYVGELYSVLVRFRSSGLIVDQNAIVEPVGDLIPAIGKTLRIIPDNIFIAA